MTIQGGELPIEAAGEPMPRENFLIAHSAAGVVSMANFGRGGNGGESDPSRFLIQTQADEPYLDDRYVAFGIVVEGMAVVRQIESLPVTSKNKPTSPVLIEATGELPL